TSFRENFDYDSNSSDTSQKQFNNSSFEDSFNEYDSNNEKTEESEEEVTSPRKKLYIMKSLTGTNF
ncbi:16987_t:CDS:1, partial [Gigaspora margarita]